MAYQLPRSIGSLSCSEMLCQRQEEHHCATQNGQHHSSCICEQAGWNSVHQTEHHCQKLWFWCMNRDITLVAEHLPGVLNTIADQESRVMRDRSDWMLNPRIFSKIQQKWGPLEVDMFASRLTTQLRRFFSWRAVQYWLFIQVIFLNIICIKYIVIIHIRLYSILSILSIFLNLPV